MALRSNVAKLKEILLKAKVVDEFQMRAAMGRLEQWGGRLTGVIIDMGFCDDETMVNALSEALRVPIAHLGMVPKDGALLAKVGVEFCDEHGIFPISLQNRIATIAMSDPTELDTVDVLSSRLNARVQVVVSAETEIKTALNKHYRNVAPPATRKKDNRARDAHIESTKGEVFELDTSPPPKPGEEAAPSNTARAWMNKAPSANTMLDEMFDEEAAPKTDGFSVEELKRLDSAVQNQKKTTAILNALQSLLTEKGYTR